MHSPHLSGNFVDMSHRQVFLWGLDKWSGRLGLLSVLWSGILWARDAKWKY